MMDWPTLNAVKRMSLRKLWEIYPKLPLTNGHKELREIVAAVEARIFATLELERQYLEHRHKGTAQGSTTTATLKEIRQARKWTQERMAAELGVTRSLYAMAETGKRELPQSVVLSLSRLVCHSPRQGYSPADFVTKKSLVLQAQPIGQNRGQLTPCEAGQEREAA